MKDRTFLSYRQDLRFGFIFPNLGPNEFAAFLAHFLFLPIGLIFYNRRKILKMFYAAVALFTLYPILFLFSRGAYVAVFIGLMYIGIKKSKMVFLGLLILVFAWSIIMPAAVIERIEMTKTEEGQLDHSSSVRFEFWAIGFEQFLRNPITGVGFDTARYFRGGDLHNAYIEILAEQGIIGLWIFLALLYGTYRNGLWLHRNAEDDFLKGLGLAAGGIAVTCSVTNLFGDRWTYMEVSAFFFIVMALVVKARTLIEKEMERMQCNIVDR
jgi:O-antigen ligase